MKIQKRTALGAIGALAASSLAVLSLGMAPAQAATTDTATIMGAPKNNLGVVWYDDGSVPQILPDNPGVPGEVSLTAVQNGSDIDYTVTLEKGPVSSAAAGFAAGDYRLDAFVRLDGAPNTRGVRAIGPVGTEDIDIFVSGQPATEGMTTFADGATINGTFENVTAGSHTLTLTDIFMDSVGNDVPGLCPGGNTFGSAPDGSDAACFDTFYNPATTGAAILADDSPDWPLSENINTVGPELVGLSATVGGDAIPASTPQTLKGGEILTITGNDQWAAGNNNVYLQLCTPGDFPSGCSPIFVQGQVAPPVSTDTTDGVLTAVRGPLADTSGFGAGAMELWMVQTSVPNGPVINSAGIPINYVPKSVSPGSITGPATVSVGANNNLAGSGWYPGETVTITAGADSTTAVADANGNISASLAVNDVNATEFEATGLGQTASSPFALSQDSCTVTDPVNGCDTSQTINAQVTAGTLSQAASATGANTDATIIEMGSTETSVTGSTLNGDLNSITVTDNRGGLDGWSLTASISGPLTAGGGATIDQANLSGVPTCVANTAESASGVTTGGAQDYSSTVNLCTKDSTADSAGGTTSGQYLVEQPLTLDVPAFQAAGDYTATITVTLV